MTIGHDGLFPAIGVGSSCITGNPVMSAIYLKLIVISNSDD